MAVIKTKLSLEMSKFFQHELDNLEKSQDFKVMMSHFGSFSQDLVSKLSIAIEDLLTSLGDKKKVVKRAFSILIEGLQNIRIHGSKDELDKQLGYLIFAGKKEEYKIIIANIICSSEREKLERYIQEINSKSAGSIKENYVSVLSNEFLSQKCGAGLGFIASRMKSRNPLRYSFKVLNEEKMLFTFCVMLDR